MTVLPVDCVPRTLGFRQPVVAEFEERNRVKRLLADADEVAADAAIEDSLFRHQHQLAIHFEKSNSWNVDKKYKLQNDFNVVLRKSNTKLAF